MIAFTDKSGKKYIAQPVEMGIWEIKTPSGNSLRFKDKADAMKHKAWIESNHL